MKKILTVYTGGTICTQAGEEGRTLAPEIARRALLTNFSRSGSKYARLCKELFEESDIPEGYQTLSENMTLEKLNRIIEHLRSFDMSKYAGVMIMHGTDTLAFTAAIVSILFAATPVPVMLVSGDRPPADKSSNANANFRAAVELIMSAIAPNVYVPYRNSDGEIYLHLGSRIMQCANYTQDFFSAGQALSVSSEELFSKCTEHSRRREGVNFPIRLCDGIKLLHPYTGLDYSDICLDRTKAVVHSSYHSGTVCVEEDSHSILYFAQKCHERGIPLFVAPCKLGAEQYSSAYKMIKSGLVNILDMTTEMAYAKLTVGISYGLAGQKLNNFMFSEINNEFVG